MTPEEFVKVKVGYGYGYGHGSGDGYRHGHGHGSGHGSGSGSGTGHGYGSGYGSGDGSGTGYGTGDGSGDGYGYGYGDDSGNGSNISNFNSHAVYRIDSISTIITSIKEHDDVAIAKGWILNSDFTLTQTFVVKQSSKFAHGSTLKEAMESLQDKLFKDMDEDKRIGEFYKVFNNTDSYDAKLFFEWHNKLTGSCLQGRESFVKNNNIDMSKKYTVKEFVEICKDSYNGNIIKNLLTR